MRHTMWVLLALGACEPPPTETPGDLPPNVLFVLLDDIGLDKTSAYEVNSAAPPTPTLERLAAEGVRFDNAYANPFCSATRSGILTGLHSFETGIGNWLLGTEARLPYDTITIPEALEEADPGLYSSAAIGKWHIADVEGYNLGEFAPLYSGFPSYQGGLNNVGGRSLTDGGWETWTHYAKSTNGVVTIESQYLTQAETDDAIAAIEGMDEPWFTYLAYHAAHEPWVPPPAAINPSGVTAADGRVAVMDAMVTSVDLEIGRLLESIDEDVLARTTVIVMSDNGTDPRVATGPDVGFLAKGTVWQRGIRVPLIVYGAQVREPGLVVEDFVQHTDVYATVLDLLGSEAPVPPSSISFAPLVAYPGSLGQRDHVYTEVFNPDGLDGNTLNRWDRALIEGNYKLIRTLAGDYLYDIATDPNETKNLAIAPDATEEVLAVYASLSTRLDAITAEAPLVLP